MLGMYSRSLGRGRLVDLKHKQSFLTTLMNRISHLKSAYYAVELTLSPRPTLVSGFVADLKGI
jgi:hypothetical protein